MPAAVEITLIAPGGIRTALQRLLPEFERKSGVKVAPTFTAGGAVKSRIAAGEVVDVPVIQPPFANVVQSGNVVAASETPLATVSVIAAVRADGPRPDISSGAALKRLLLAAQSIACPGIERGAACGVSFAATLEKLGISDQVRPKVAAAPSGWGAIEMLARGEVEIGITFASENDPDPRVAVLGPLPRDASTPTALVGFVHARSKAPAEARALLQFLTTPEAAQVFRDCGMTPGR